VTNSVSQSTAAACRIESEPPSGQALGCAIAEIRRIRTTRRTSTQAQGRVFLLDRTAFVPSRSNESHPIRVLLADSDESLQHAYRTALAQEGIELQTALSGLDCVARLRECTPDLLILELQVPWGGGDGVLAIMSHTVGLTMVPVMILTSCSDPLVLKGVGRFPVSDYQVKPLAPDHLARRLRSLLDHPRLRFTLDDHNGRLECAIVRRTGGRVRDLRVDVREGRVIVSGCTESCHVKQLALAAVLEAAAVQSLKVESEIEVCGDCQSTVQEMCFNSHGKRGTLRWHGSDETDRDSITQ